MTEEGTRINPEQGSKADKSQKMRSLIDLIRAERLELPEGAHERLLRLLGSVKLPV